MFTKAIFEEKTLKDKIILSMLATLALAITAQISFHIPITPVPITLQVLAMLIIGFTFSEKLAVYSVIQYIALGLMGLPVFSDGKNGISVFLSPTGGYVIGFILMAFIIPKTLKMWKSPIISGICGIFVLYAMGIAYLSCFLIANGQNPMVSYALAAVPFIGVDLVKLLIAVSVYSCIKKTKES